MRAPITSPVALAMREGDEGSIVTALRRLSRDVIDYDASLLAREARALLRTTKSNRVRNAAAVGLADMRAPSAASSIIEVLRNPDVVGSSGTLLFALGELDALIPFDVIVSIIENGSFESRAEAMIAVEEGRITAISSATAQEAHSTLERLSKDRENVERAEVAREALKYLENLLRGNRHRR